MSRWTSLNTHSELFKGIRFLAVLSVVGAMSYAVLSFFMNPLQWTTAVLSSWVLALLGIGSQAVMGSPPLLLGVFSMPVGIVPLCVGDIEIAVLLGGIAATEDRTTTERAWGMLAGILFVLLINPFRIGLTLAAGVWWGVQAMEFFHSLLFRITLLVVIVGFYTVWYLGLPTLKRKFKK